MVANTKETSALIEWERKLMEQFDSTFTKDSALEAAKILFGPSSPLAPTSLAERHDLLTIFIDEALGNKTQHEPGKSPGRLRFPIKGGSAEITFGLAEARLRLKEPVQP